jgi:hypothetical protein
MLEKSQLIMWEVTSVRQYWSAPAAIRVWQTKRITPLGGGGKDHAVASNAVNGVCAFQYAHA